MNSLATRLIAPLLMMAILPTAAMLNASTPPVPDHAPEVRLTGRVVSMPIVMVREFPFIEGEIAGVKGKLMLDTGMQDALVINDHRVPITGGEQIGMGHFGSGQTFTIRLNASVSGIRIDALKYSQATQVRSQDARMLERITPDFIGWVGYDFFAGHAMKLDYRQLKVTFYQGGPEEFLAGEVVIAVIPFETRKLPNIPLLPARIGDVDAIVSLDTGLNGSLYTTAEKRRLLINSGHLKPSPNSDTHDLLNARLADIIDSSFPDLEVDEEASPSATSVGVTEETELELGYVFLRQYKTVWDYRQKQIYLLAPQ